jgi:hypothetical protein
MRKMNMKTMNAKIKKMVHFGLALTAFGAMTSADVIAAMPFKEGGYVGRLNRNKNIHLLTRKIHGRDGSFMAVLFKKRDEACVYVVDPTESPVKYAMTPLQVTPDGEIGFNNDNPSLVMTITRSADPEKPEFTLVNANGGNTACIQGSATFAGSDSRFNWDRAIIPGAYSAGGIRRVGNFSTSTYVPGDSSLEGSVTLTRPFKRPGDYVVREKAPGLFTLKVAGYTATGAVVEKVPSYVGFAASTPWGASVYLINPADHTDVIQLQSDSY